MTTAIYEGLLHASLDPRRGVVVVSSVAPLRDLAPGSAAGIGEALKAWEARCDDALAEIEASIAEIRQRAAEEDRSARRRQTVFEAEVTKEDTSEMGKAKGGKRGLGSSDDGEGIREIMDVDEDEGGRETRSSKRGAKTLMGFFGR